ncbi:hypothetical protein JAAARDRAFT_42871 [Jaapia argillacea MUCL 33604]|uniref:Uncharacterized protein n=1 Tax=Jaapia argillacea MUCL 33604 TaxID=933084 RepID=A0A067P6N4_9AGAM|nr:hypothetical protein JAAARDRAFT_42871 [Jaapia argillacea MUCL 33604]
MAEPRISMQRSPQTPSHIPIPRATPGRSSLPTSLSLPPLSLVPPTRIPSGTKTPLASPAANSSSSSLSSIGSTPGAPSGLSSFRSLRNLFPFGSTKHQVANGNGNGSPSVSFAAKSHIPSFGSLRRSSQTERKSSSARPPMETIDDHSPVLNIDRSPRSPRLAPHMSLEEEFARHHFSFDLEKSLPAPPLTTPLFASFHDGPSIIASPPIPNTDLSTILESETSGISKHLPPLDDVKESSDAGHSSSGDAAKVAEDFSLLSASKGNANHRGHTPDSRSSSMLDLSTSKIGDEVMHAMKEAGSGKDWSKAAVVVEDVASAKKLQSSDVEVSGEASSHGRNPSLDLTTLDPDLAALLSPHRFGDTEPALLVAVDAIPPPSSPIHAHSENPTSSMVRDSHSPASSQSRPSGSSSRVGQLSSPYSRHADISRSPSSSPVPSSSTSLPRRTRRVSERPFSAHGDLDSSNSPSMFSDSTMKDHVRRSSSDSRSRQPPPSPLRETHASSRTPVGDDNHSRRLPGQSRLVTPARPPSSAAASSSSRPHFRHLTSNATTGHDRDSASPLARASSATASAPNHRTHEHRPSMEDIGRASLDSQHDRFSHLRTRKRSVSMGGKGASPPVQSHMQPTPRSTATDWLGPRTAKAFAAAGLLDFDRDGYGQAVNGSGGPSSYQGGSRYTTVRSVMSERDSRSQFAPSRLAFSEASGSNSSWGRSGSVSRAANTPDTGLMDSPTFSTAARTFSGSTAPTSVSGASSSHHQYLQSELQSLRERHSAETEALLSALADSQRSAKVMRDENAELRDRIAKLEIQLDDALAQLRRQQQFQYTPPTSHVPLNRSVFERTPRPGSADGAHRRSTSRLQTYPRSREHSPRVPLQPELLDPHSIPPPRDVTPGMQHRRRSSTTSSVFVAPPNNMTLLLQEDGGLGSDHSGAVSTKSFSRPPSPTLVIPKKKPSRLELHKSMSFSNGNISPTTTAFSIVPDSPGSLNLRPEHEMLLGDMASIHLGEDDDYDSVD